MSDTPERKARMQQLLEELWQLDEEIEEQMTAIPTTANVRDAYSSESSDSRYANRMFDLWLAKYKAKTISKEQERIIKLLKSIEGTYYEEDHAWSLKDGLNLAIQLIEGEKK